MFVLDIYTKQCILRTNPCLLIHPTGGINMPYNTNLKPLMLASPGTASPIAKTPLTCSPLSSFLFKRIRTMRRKVAAQMATKAVAQLTLIATTMILIIRIFDFYLLPRGRHGKDEKGAYQSVDLHFQDTYTRHIWKKNLQRR